MAESWDARVIMVGNVCGGTANANRIQIAFLHPLITGDGKMATPFGSQQQDPDHR